MNATIFLLAAVAFVVVAIMTVTGPLLPVLASDFSTTVGRASIVVTAFAVPYGAFQIVFGPIGDRYGKLRVIAVALGTATLFVVASGYAASLDQLAILRFFSGIALAATIPLAMAWIADEVPAAVRQPVIGRYVHGLVLGQIAGAVLGGVGAEFFDWRTIFFVLGAVCAVVSLLLWLRAERGVKASTATLNLREVLALYVDLFREPRTRDIIIVGTLEGVLIFGVLAFLGAFLRHEHGLDYARIGIILGAYGLGGMLYAAAVYRIVRYLGERRMVVIGSGLLGAGYVLLALSPTWLTAAPVLLMAGFGFYLFHNTMQMQATELSQTARGTAVSLWVFMVFLGQGLGVSLFGAVVDGIGYVPLLVGAGFGVSLLGAWFARRMQPHALHDA